MVAPLRVAGREGEALFAGGDGGVVATELAQRARVPEVRLHLVRLQLHRLRRVGARGVVAAA